MKRYQLNVLRRAEFDLDRIFGWLAERSPQGAVSWYRAYDDAVESLRENPERCTRALEAEMFAHDIRQMVFQTALGRSYRVLFVVRSDIVHILTVRGPGQDLLQQGNLELPD